MVVSKANVQNSLFWIGGHALFCGYCECAIGSFNLELDLIRTLCGSPASRGNSHRQTNHDLLKTHHNPPELAAEE